jgi:hypothetical protein
MDSVQNCDSYINIPSSQTYKTKLNSMVWVRERIIPTTERPPLVGEVIANFCG